MGESAWLPHPPAWHCQGCHSSASLLHKADPTGGRAGARHSSLGPGWVAHGGRCSRAESGGLTSVIGPCLWGRQGSNASADVWLDTAIDWSRMGVELRGQGLGAEFTLELRLWITHSSRFAGLSHLALGRIDLWVFPWGRLHPTWDGGQRRGKNPTALAVCHEVWAPQPQLSPLETRKGLCPS